MNTRTLRLCLIATLSCAATAALAENPFAGTWKIDYSQSKLTGGTVTFAPAPGDKVTLTEEGRSYSFKLDGSDSTTPFGDIAQWTKVDDTTWQAVYKKGTTTLSTDTWKLSSDGKSLDTSSTGTKPNGDQFNEAESYTRIAPGKGFYGKWKSTKMTNDKPNTAQIDANGDDGIVWNIPEIKASVSLKFDGKDVAPTGPTVPDGLTLAATKTGPRGFSLVEKINGKVIWRGHFTVSADGKTLTEFGGAPGVNEPEKVVYQKS
jgi:hypothetical protein